VLRDLGSTNGTWVNGKRVELHTLKPGDRIEVTGDPSRREAHMFYVRNLHRRSDGFRYDHT
jgi:hypothetical protein